MAKSKYTPWFPGDVKPVRVGWYQASGDGFVDGPGCVMRKWNGSGWLWASIYEGGRQRQARVESTDKWRGLAEKPA